jgi:thiamine pyrophosphate-dependent acetolactate synthase large subunit-like protein
MLGKEAIVSFLANKQIQHIFHLPGIHSLPLCQSFAKHGVKAVMGRHESAVAFAAIGYAQATGSLGVLVVTPGPGLGNVVSACLEAYGGQVPLLIIHIDTERKEIGKGILHELPEPERIFRHFTKGTFTVEQEESLFATLGSAHEAALSGRPGPALISIPYALLEKEVDSPVNNVTVMPKKPDLTGLEEALSGKERPVIIGGGSLMTDELRLPLEILCRELAIPFLTTTAGKGIMSEDRLETFGSVMRKGVTRDILKASDLVIAIGTRLRDVDAKRRGVKIRELIHIDVDDAWIGKNYPTKLGIAGDIKASVDGLCQVMKGRRSSWHLKELKTLQRKEEAKLLQNATGFRIISLLREVIPEDTVSVWDLNLTSYWAEYYFPVLRQKTFLGARGSSTIFYAVPASIGAKLGRPDRPCLCVVGDGGGLPMLGELATARQYNVPVVFLVYNNNSFGILEHYMKQRYALEGSMDLVSPDFVQLARAFDIPAKCVESLEDLRDLFLHRIRFDEPFLIEFKYPNFPLPWEIE